MIEKWRDRKCTLYTRLRTISVRVVHQTDNKIFTDVFFCTSGKHSMDFLWTEESQENQALLKYANDPKGYANTNVFVAHTHCLRVGVRQGFQYLITRNPVLKTDRPRVFNWLIRHNVLKLTGYTLCQNVRHLTARRQNPHAHMVDNENLKKKTEDNRCYFKILLNVLKTQKSHRYLPISIFLYTFDDPIKDFCRWNTMIWNDIFCLLF